MTIDPAQGNDGSPGPACLLPYREPERSMPHAKRAAQVRRTLYELLEQGPVGARRPRAVSRLIILLVVINLVAAALETVPSLDFAYGRWFAAIEWVSLVLFTVEYVARLWVAVEHTRDRHLSPWRARLRFVISPAGLVDLLAVLPFWIGLLVVVDLRFLLVFRVVRFLKLARYSPAMRSLIEVLYAERRALFGCVVILVGSTLVAGSLMYLAERHVQPDKLGTVPDAMWWAIVTLGTIGYGDVVPMTAVGKVIASITIFGGLVMVALPVGIIATAFSDQIHRRDFVVTWGMVAKVPLFCELEAGDIADIMRLLRAQIVDAGAVVVRRGDPAHSMYFIAAGEVEIELQDRAVRLGIGHFFGEVAVLRRARRSATVTALTRTNLLVLEGQDLHALIEREPRIAARMREMVRLRLGRELVSERGDIVTEEIDEAAASPGK
jgi:voltage-gated potassium channel